MKITPQHHVAPTGYPACRHLNPLQTAALAALACTVTSCDQMQQRTLGEPPMIPNDNQTESDNKPQQAPPGKPPVEGQTPSPGAAKDKPSPQNKPTAQNTSLPAPSIPDEEADPFATPDNIRRLPGRISIEPVKEVANRGTIIEIGADTLPDEP